MIVKGNLYLEDSPILSLGNLTEVKEELYLHNCKNLKDLGKVKKTGSLDLGGCENIISLNNLKEVNGTLNLYGCKNLKDLGKLKKCKLIYLDEFLITKEYVEKNYPNMINFCSWRSDIS